MEPVREGHKRRAKKTRPEGRVFHMNQGLLRLGLGSCSRLGRWLLRRLSLLRCRFGRRLFGFGFGRGLLRRRLGRCFLRRLGFYRGRWFRCFHRRRCRCRGRRRRWSIRSRCWLWRFRRLRLLLVIRTAEQVAEEVALLRRYRTRRACRCCSRNHFGRFKGLACRQIFNLAGRALAGAQCAFQGARVQGVGVFAGERYALQRTFPQAPELADLPRAVR